MVTSAKTQLYSSLNHSKIRYAFLFFKYFPPSVYAGRPPPFVALDANTGAIALANKSLQIRDKYPDSDDERPSSKTTTPKILLLITFLPFL
jgi:hypothetical protein